MLDLLEDHIIAGRKVELEVPYRVTCNGWSVLPGYPGWRRTFHLYFCLNRKGELCFHRNGRVAKHVFSVADGITVMYVETDDEFRERMVAEREEQAKNWAEQVATWTRDQEVALAKAKIA